MSQKVSLWALVGVAAIALMLMANIANIGTSDVTGLMVSTRPPRAIPASMPPLGQETAPCMADTTACTGSTNDQAARTAMAEQMARIEKHQCYLINLQIDRDSGKNTPVELISKTCPRWV